MPEPVEAAIASRLQTANGVVLAAGVLVAPGRPALRGRRRRRRNGDRPFDLQTFDGRGGFRCGSACRGKAPDRPIRTETRGNIGVQTVISRTLEPYFRRFADLALYLDRQMPPEAASPVESLQVERAIAVSAPAAAPAAPAVQAQPATTAANTTPLAVSAPAAGLEGVMQSQLQLVQALFSSNYSCSSRLRAMRSSPFSHKCSRSSPPRRHQFRCKLRPLPSQLRPPSCRRRAVTTPPTHGA